MGFFGLSIVLIIILLIIYYSFFYRKHKFIDPKKTVLSETPPEDFSPAALRYVWNAGYDSDCMLAGMVNASSKGAYGMVWYPNRFSIRLKNPNLLNKLSEDERSGLCYSRNNPVKALSFESERNKFTNRAEERMMNNLDERYSHLIADRERYQKKGLLIASALFSIVLGIFTSFNFAEPFILGILLGATMMAYQWLLDGIIEGWDWFFGMRDFVMVSAGGALIALLDYAAAPEAWYTLYFLPILVVVSIAYVFMPRFTEEGEKIWYQINGYRDHLLKIVEKDNFTSDESLLTNQIALSISSEATKPFEGLLTQQKVEKHDYYNPYAIGLRGFYKR